MICHVCGTENSTGGVCRRCGAALPMQNMRPGVRVIKDIGASGPFLAAAIFSTCAVALQLLQLLFVNAFRFDVFDSFYTFDSIITGSITTVLEVVFVIPSVLLVVAFWMFYSSCRRADGWVSSTALSIFQALSILGQVFAWLGIGFLAFCLVMIPVTNTGSAGGIIVGEIFTIGLVVAVLAFEINFSFKTLRAIHAVKYTAACGEPSDDIPGFMIVWCYILGGFSLISVCTLDFSSACMGVVYLLIAPLLSRYKRQMQSLSMPSSYGAAAASQTDWVSGEENERLSAQVCAGCGRPLESHEAFCPQCGRPRQR